MFQAPLWGCACWFGASPATPHPVSNPPPCERVALISVGPLGREREIKKEKKRRVKKAFVMSQIWRIRQWEAGLQSTERAFGHHINK